ncbi:hypothetical protein BDV59DRAFT_25838 [Aspergillus ambiguus]|uniref:uncharacterized protein n=1 Tax=Aspergillus ambiguus TaxID=176160 RepID=UPI003CCD1587
MSFLALCYSCWFSCKSSQESGVVLSLFSWAALPATSRHPAGPVCSSLFALGGVFVDFIFTLHIILSAFLRFCTSACSVTYPSIHVPGHLIPCYFLPFKFLTILSYLFIIIYLVVPFLLLHLINVLDLFMC